MANYTKYSMLWKIHYTDRLVDVMDEIRAIPYVVVASINKDIGAGKELITVKILTKGSALLSYKSVRQLCLSRIRSLKSVKMVTSSLTKIF